MGDHNHILDLAMFDVVMWRCYVAMWDVAM
jgi:hypothetical protein